MYLGAEAWWAYSSGSGAFCVVPHNATPTEGGESYPERRS
jgi:hypothetical protein